MGSGSSAQAKYAAPADAGAIVGRVSDADMAKPYDLIVIGGGPAGVRELGEARGVADVASLSFGMWLQRCRRR